MTLALWTSGCTEATVERPPAPRPVSVLTLVESDPGRFQRVSGSVASWKSDQLGFEVSGRVQFVIETASEIAGVLEDDQGTSLMSGTLLARLDPRRYELAVQSAQAQVEVAEKQLRAAQIEYESQIPAQQQAAQARLKLAQQDIDRNRPLLASGAITPAQFDSLTATLVERQAEVAQLEAAREAKEAEVASLGARLREQQEDLKQAERDLADCELYSSFPGQVAAVHVIPGSFVQQGQAVVTVQMMDPIKVEFEVAATTAQRVNHRERINVYVRDVDGELLLQRGFVYTIDPVADPQTRTFTVTVMMRNPQVPPVIPEGVDPQNIARCGLVGRIFEGFPGVSEGLFVNEKVLQREGNDFYLWKILSPQVGVGHLDSDRLLNVVKVRVEPSGLRIPFLDLVTLREIVLADDNAVDPASDVFAGEVTTPDGHADFDKGQMLLQTQRWLVRPGDLVEVDRSSEPIQPGYYIPFDAIQEQSGDSYIFVVAPSPAGDTARRINVDLFDRVGTLQRVEAVEGPPPAPGDRVIVSGAAFLVDSERVNVARQVQLGR